MAHLHALLDHLGLVHRLRMIGESMLALAGANDLFDLFDKIEQLIDRGE